MGLGNGLVGLFKQWGKGIGNAADHVWLREEAQKAIRDEITQKFKPKIDLANTAESKRATNIKDLDAKLTQSKKDLADAQKAWQDKYNSELAAAQTKRQTDIAGYDAKLKGYKGALDTANKGKQDILDQLYDQEANYDLNKTVFRDVKSGDTYIFDPYSGKYKELTAYRRGLKTKKDRQAFDNRISNSEYRLFDKGSDRVINAFDDADAYLYGSDKFFNSYKNRVQSLRNSDIRNAENQIRQANDDLTNWTANNSQPKAWGKRDLNQFEQDFKNNNGASPTEYSFNGKNYSDATALDAAYQKALNHAQYKRDYFRTKASNYASERDKEIAQRIQDAKDINKAKVALGGTLGAGALYAGARAMYGGDDTPDTPDNTDNTNTGEPDPHFNIEKEGQAILNNEQQSDTALINTGFDPDKADALAAAAYDTGVEEGNSIESNDDLGNNIGATTRGHTMDDRLYELIKAMQDPYKADAVANYIYSRHGDDPEVQRLGWRGWLNKYYGDSLRSKMNIDPSGYKGMHVSGGL